MSGWLWREDRLLFAAERGLEEMVKFLLGFKVNVLYNIRFHFLLDLNADLELNKG